MMLVFQTALISPLESTGLLSRLVHQLSFFFSFSFLFFCLSFFPPQNWTGNAAHAAARNGFDNLLKNILICARKVGLLEEVRDATNSMDGSTPLIFACWRKRVDCVRVLIEFGAKLDLVDKVWDQLLQLACK